MAHRRDLTLPVSPAVLRRLPAVGRAAQWGLHEIPGIVLVDTLAHDTPGVWIPRGYVVLRIWADGPEDERGWGDRVVQIWAHVREAQEPWGHRVVPVVLRSTRWARARAWWWRLWWERARRSSEARR